MLQSPLPSDYQHRSRSPEWERELRDWLRTQSEEKRFAFLMELRKYHIIVSLQLAHKTLAHRDSHLRLLHHAVRTCDASSIKYWLDCVVPRLGFRRTIAALLQLVQENPRGVAKATYWLPGHVQSSEDETRLTELRDAVVKFNTDSSG